MVVLTSPVPSTSAGDHPWTRSEITAPKWRGTPNRINRIIFKKNDVGRVGRRGGGGVERQVNQLDNWYLSVVPQFSLKSKPVLYSLCLCFNILSPSYVQHLFLSMTHSTCKAYPSTHFFFQQPFNCQPLSFVFVILSLYFVLQYCSSAGSVTCAAFCRASPKKRAGCAIMPKSPPKHTGVYTPEYIRIYLQASIDVAGVAHVSKPFSSRQHSSITVNQIWSELSRPACSAN